MEIAIGTAQFGLPYGIANNNEQVSNSMVEDILAAAIGNNISTLDTAAAYGSSEEVLGAIGVGKFDVVSKLAPRNCENSALDGWVKSSVETSIKRLKLDSIYGYLLHRPMELLGKNGEVIYDTLVDLKSQGMLKKIGVSVYDPEELELLSQYYSFDLIQFPLSVFDRRMLDSGWLTRLKAQGVELHVRSAFLQGLLLMSPKERPPYFDQWEALFSTFDSWLEDSSLTPLQACVGFLNGISEVDKLVVGVNSVEHFMEVITAASDKTIEVPAAIQSFDMALINPGSWNI